MPFLIKRLHPERCNISGAWIPRTSDEYEKYNLCSEAIRDSINYQDFEGKYDIIRVREKSHWEFHNESYFSIPFRFNKIEFCMLLFRIKDTKYTAGKI